MDLKELIEQYLPTINVMQLATSRDNRPYAVNIHFYSDGLNIYWISTEARRHSEELKLNPKACAALKIHENTEEEDWVVGLSLEGEAMVVDVNDLDPSVVEGFIAKLNTAPTLKEDIASGKNPHKFYVLKPTKATLFDNKTFPENPRQELNLS